MSEVAVVLMAYGSPDRLEDVPAYYADIRGGRPIRPELLENLVERYRRLGIEVANPLNAITEETRAALELELGAPVFTGMKHWQPRIAAAAESALAAGAKTIVGLVLAPHYSRGSIAGYRKQLDDAVAWPGRRSSSSRAGTTIAGLIALLAERVRGTDAHVVFTAHSLPARVLQGGDPYEEQLLETSRLVAEAAGVEDWSFSYQSESATGEPWLQPDILDHLPRSGAEGVDAVLICPVGFVSDHLEIRWDLDIEAKERAAELGLRYEPDRDAECRSGLYPRPRRHRPARGGATFKRMTQPGADRDRPRHPPLPRLPAARTHAQGAARRAPPLARDGRLGAARRVREHRARRGGRADRPQRLGEDDLLRLVAGIIKPTSGTVAVDGPCRVAARARRRLPPRVHGPRERLPERRHPRPQARRHPAAHGRDRRLRGAGALHRRPGADVLVGDVHAARLRRRRAPRASTCCCSTRCSPWATRSSSASASGRSSSSSSAAARSSSSPTTRPRSTGSARGPCCCATARSRSTARRARRSRSTTGCWPRSASPTSEAPASASTAAARRASPSAGSWDRGARSESSSRRASSSPSMSASTRQRTYAPPKLSWELRDEAGLVLAAGSTRTADIGWRTGASEQRFRFDVESLPLGGRPLPPAARADGRGGRTALPLAGRCGAVRRLPVRRRDGPRPDRRSLVGGRRGRW